MEQEKKYTEEDEITLKELILKVQEYCWEVVRNWKWVVLITIPFVAFFLYKAISTPTTYAAQLTFMVNEDDGNGLGGMSAILGQFGLGGGKSKNNLDKILELAKSQRILNEVVFEKVKIGGVEDYLANHIIRIYDYEEKWDSDTTGLKNFRFTQDSLPAFSLIENRAIKRIYSNIIGTKKTKKLLESSYEDATGIMNLEVSTLNEALSMHLCSNIYEKLSSFYVNKTIEKQQQTFNVMLQKVDSISNMMSQKEYELASFLDSNRGLLNSKDRLRELRLRRDVEILNQSYGASLKNFEIADFSLKNKTPYIQVIDYPFAPLPRVEISIVKQFVLGLVAGLFFSILIIVLRKIYIETMQGA